MFSPWVAPAVPPSIGLCLMDVAVGGRSYRLTRHEMLPAWVSVEGRRRTPIQKWQVRDMAGADRAKSLDAVMAQIEKAHGKGAVMRLGDEVRVPIDVIPTGSIALDVALGIGGLPRGRVVEIYGPESSGKTTVALHAVANAQKAGGIAAFIDAEHALDPDYAQKLGVDTDALLVSHPVTNWFDNGVAEHFLQFTVQTSAGNGRSQFAATDNHLIRTPGGWREAGELIVGDRVLANETARLSDQQWQLVLGGLMGNAHLAPNPRDRHGVCFRMGHGEKQVEYLDWKASLFGNIAQSRNVNVKGAVFVALSPLCELGELRDVVYWGDGNKHLTDDYFKSLSPLALAIWFMDDGSFSERSKGLQQRTAGSGRVEFCVEAMSEASRVRLADYLRDVHGIDSRLSIRVAAKKAVLTMTTAGSSRFLELVAPYVHPSMSYKLLPGLRGQFGLAPQFVEPSQVLVSARVLSVKTKPQTRSMHRFDIEVAGTHNYFVDGVMVHNSPETTTGGKALKFYASVRLDVRRIETLKDGTDPVGNRTRVKVVKNKVAPPFKQAEFDIIYGFGISREGGLIDMGVEHGFVRKAGAWYTYEGDQLGQGKENARSFLKDNPDLSDELEKKIKEKLGIGPRVDQKTEPIAAVPLKAGPSIKSVPIKNGPLIRNGSAKARPFKDLPIEAVPINGMPVRDVPVDF